MGRQNATEIVEGGPARPVYLIGGLIELTDENGIALLLDSVEKAIVSVDSVHHEVHDGEVFECSAYLESIADDENLDLQITTGARKVHTSFGAELGGDGTFSFHRSPTTSDGTPVIAYNMEHSSAAVPISTLVHSPTVSDTGTQIIKFFLPGGSGPQAVGGTTRGNLERILKANTKYLFRLTNISGQAQPGSILLQFYEK